jgi:hypothetical protein
MTEWTTEKPGDPGYYWYRARPDAEPIKVEVDWNFTVYLPNDVEMPIEVMSGEWATSRELEDDYWG